MKVRVPKVYPCRALAIDPGPKTSGVVILDTRHDPPQILRHWQDMSTKVLRDNLWFPDRFDLFGCPFEAVLLERVASFGMPVGETTINTILWSGRLMEVCERVGIPLYRMTRKKVVHSLCFNIKAGDSNVRRAILDLYPKTGGGKTPQIGTKNQPGPLYGIANDAFAALALGIAWARKHGHIELVHI